MSTARFGCPNCGSENIRAVFDSIATQEVESWNEDGSVEEWGDRTDWVESDVEKGFECKDCEFGMTHGKPFEPVRLPDLKGAEA